MKHLANAMAYDDVIGVADLKIRSRRFARIAGETHVAMASPAEILQQTGYAVGAIPPFGLARALPVFIDKALASCEVLYVGSGAFGTEVLISPENLRKATEGTFADIVI